MSEIRITSPAGEITVRMGDGPAQLTDGIGGWQAVARADRVAISEWQGVNPFAQDIPVLLDGFREGRSVQPDLDRLLALSKTPQRTEPPPFTVTGPIHFPELQWVLNGIQMGDAIRSGGDLRRQALTLQLLEYQQPVGLQVVAATAPTTSPGPRLYTVKGNNETLQTIALKKLGKSSRAKEIGDLNGIRDVRKKLKQGRQLRLP